MKTSRKDGFTLIELLLASLIIVILVIGGAAALYHTGSNVKIQGNKRIALEVANQRLELAKANSYLGIAPNEYDEDSKYFLKPSKDDPVVLVLTVSKTPEDITVGDAAYKMRTKVLRHSKAGGSVGFDTECLQLTVSVDYGTVTGEAVELETLVLPPWLVKED